ncbi:MAG: hypothetical protein QNK37_16575 [Acidobacteriota bacterium]|nr:hypothetical protein [Acidobacteriota bacterium]
MSETNINQAEVEETSISHDEVDEAVGEGPKHGRVHGFNPYAVDPKPCKPSLDHHKSQ